MTDSERVHELFRVTERLLRRGAKRIVLDLQRVERADTKLLACIVVLYRMARRSSARIEVSVSRAVRDIARICRLEWLTDHLSNDHPGS